MGHKEMAEFLLARGAGFSAKDNRRSTPLHWAAKMGHIELVELLLTTGADVNAMDRYGETPLHQAASHAEASELPEKEDP